MYSLMKCPYCNKTNFVPEIVFTHTEGYGSGYKNFECTHCGRVILALCSLKVVISDVCKTDNKSDW